MIEHNFLALLSRVNIACFHRQILFSFPDTVCSSAKFPAHTHDISFLCQIFHAHLLFTRLDDVLSRLERIEQKPSRAVPRVGDTSDTSGDESSMGEPR